MYALDLVHRTGHSHLVVSLSLPNVYLVVVQLKAVEAEESEPEHRTMITQYLKVMSDISPEKALMFVMVERLHRNVHGVDRLRQM